MRIPQAPTIQDVPHLSATVYREMAACKARGAWSAHGDRALVPSHPAALLGIAAHRVLEAANKGRFAGDRDVVREAARELFDSLAIELYDSCHPLIRVKFRSAQHLPYYSIYRERAVSRVITACDRRTAEPEAGGAARGMKLVEARLASGDGQLVGYPDLIDQSAGEVVDYKNGSAPDALEVLPAETSQLRLYAFLAAEAGVAVDKGTIVRADGRRATIGISPAEAQREAALAREALASYREKVGAKFEDAAEPSAQNCRFCECIPFCERFWAAAEQAWQGVAGCHVQGVVQKVDASTQQGVPLITLIVASDAGTVPRGPVVVEQIPAAWLTAGGDPVPSEGEKVRVCHASPAGSASVVRVDRVLTAVWR